MTNEKDILQTWLDTLKQEGKSPSTQNGYQRSLQHFIRWFEGAGGQAFSPSLVIPRDVRDWVAYQQTVEKAKPTTVAFRVTALRKFFRWAQRKNLIREDPTETVRPPRIPQTGPRSLSRTEERRLLRAVYREGNKRDIAIIEVLLGTGLRVGELLALRIGDVTLGKRRGKVVVRKGKHGQYREVPLVGEARRALAAYLEDHPQRDNPDSLLWWGQRGPLRTNVSVWGILQKYGRLAQIERITPHMLRHTFATRYLENNPGDLVGLATLLGHASLNTVMIYTTPNLTDLAERMEKHPGDR